jgi:hypothetical protein
MNSSIAGCEASCANEAVANRRGGTVGIWFTNGTHVTQFAGVATVPTVWSIKDANAD